MMLVGHVVSSVVQLGGATCGVAELSHRVDHPSVLGSDAPPAGSALVCHANEARLRRNPCVAVATPWRIRPLIMDLDNT